MRVRALLVLAIPALIILAAMLATMGTESSTESWLSRAVLERDAKYVDYDPVCGGPSFVLEGWVTVNETANKTWATFSSRSGSVFNITFERCSLVKAKTYVRSATHYCIDRIEGDRVYLKRVVYTRGNETRQETKIKPLNLPWKPDRAIVKLNKTEFIELLKQYFSRNSRELALFSGFTDIAGALEHYNKTLIVYTVEKRLECRPGKEILLILDVPLESNENRTIYDTLGGMVDDAYIEGVLAPALKAIAEEEGCDLHYLIQGHMLIDKYNKTKTWRYGSLRGALVTGGVCAHVESITVKLARQLGIDAISLTIYADYERVGIAHGAALLCDMPWRFHRLGEPGFYYYPVKVNINGEEKICYLYADTGFAAQKWREIQYAYVELESGSILRNITILPPTTKPLK